MRRRSFGFWLVWGLGACADAPAEIANAGSDAESVRPGDARTADALGVDARAPGADAETDPADGTAPASMPDLGAVADDDAGPAPTPDAATPPVGADHGAAFVDQSVPGRVNVGQRFAVRVTMRNTGAAPWSRAAGYFLGTTDPMDDPTWGETRAFMDPDAVVPTDGTWGFTATLTAPALPGTYGMRWQMLQDAVEWFGEPSPATPVEVVDAPPPVQAPFDLGQVEIVGSPDVRGWPVTSQITSIGFRPGTFHIDHTLRGQWPPVVIDPNDGTEQEATVWVFFYIGDRWYGTGGERLRPGQFEKELTHASDIGPGWLYDANRWGPMTNYIPQPGELVGFMIAAGSTRSDDHVAVQERTAVVLIPFPRDDEAADFPPFAGGE
jgi:hypothetical protein